MKITKNRIQTIEETVNEEVLCNKCGESLFVLIGIAQDTDERIVDTYGIVEHTYTGGYGSDPLHDLTSYTFSLCEPCLAELFKSFTIPVQEYCRYEQDKTEGIQEKLNTIHTCDTSDDLTNYLLDQSEIVRAYARLRIEKLTNKDLHE